MRHSGKRTEKLRLTFVCLMAVLLTAYGSNVGISNSTSSSYSTAVGTPKAAYGKQVYRYPIIGPSSLD